MSVIVDTSIWSLALRRNTPNSEIVDRLRTLIAEDEVSILGAIRQEILSGIRTAEQFTRLRDYLRAFPDLTLVQDDYEIAAEFFNTCRRNGIQGSNTDFLICAAAYRRNDSIFTTDQDFRSFQTYLPIQLLE
ncbi:MAG: PIN domain-containing protein [Leptolyngbya sp. UWPOB_LEPTO1]|uniref:type II toxin-antitoxin system VapC family toxin n=1 Tax=Leptolyngbya sp. UWPOB_LEPTO1 TaxID=2815653 RepID=UPI001ACE09E5|nr:PIN domain-containing protein [Leptolyngbya sp. UWPOB_LEPTO1]MBN8564060.1 PIN domain-containing protein [Leptolyngbya sp. UWPOB_LEPTO1]